MMISELVAQDKDISIVELAGKLEQFVRRAAEDGECLHDVEQRVLGSVLLLGRRCVDQFLALQGDGDLGETVRTADDRILKRSNEPAKRRIRTVFGEHHFSAYTAYVFHVFKNLDSFHQSIRFNHNISVSHQDKIAFNFFNSPIIRSVHPKSSVISQNFASYIKLLQTPLSSFSSFIFRAIIN